MRVYKMKNRNTKRSPTVPQQQEEEVKHGPNKFKNVGTYERKVPIWHVGTYQHKKITHSKRKWNIKNVGTPGWIWYRAGSSKMACAPSPDGEKDILITRINGPFGNREYNCCLVRPDNWSTVPLFPSQHGLYRIRWLFQRTVIPI